MAIHSLFENILEKLLTEHGNFKIAHEFPVSTANLRIDLMIAMDCNKRGKNSDNATPMTSSIDDNCHLPRPFHHSRRFLIGEYKSLNEKINSGTLSGLVGKAGIVLYRSWQGKRNKPGREALFFKKNLTWQDVSLYMILSRAKQLFNSLREKYQAEELEQGIYKLNSFRPMDIFVVALDECILEGKFQVLKLFSDKKTRQNVMMEGLKKGNDYILGISYILFKEELIELTKSMKESVSEPQFTIRDAILTLGITRVVEEVGLDKVIEEVGLDKVIEEVGLDKVIEEVGLDKVIEEVGLDKVIEEVGLDKVIEEIGLENLIEIFAKIDKKKRKEVINNLSPARKKKLKRALKELIQMMDET